MVISSDFAHLSSRCCWPVRDKPHLQAGFTLGDSCVGFPCGSAGKESPCSAGDPGVIPGSRRSSGGGMGFPLQHSWASLVAQMLKNPPAMWETPGLGRFPGGGDGSPFWYSCLENFHGQRSLAGCSQSTGLQRVGHD